MPCVKCEGCSWYRDINICQGQADFKKNNCPVEQQLGGTNANKNRFRGREPKGMRPWGRRKVVGS